MSNSEKISKLMEKNNGYVTTREVVSNKIDKKFLSDMVKKGKIVRISRGYYGLPTYIEDEYYKISSKSNNAIFSMTTALYLHNLSDRTPLYFIFLYQQVIVVNFKKKKE